MMGSGGMIVMDEDTCMVDIAKFFLEFTVDESCGKCPPCRIGTKRMLEILTRITEGKGSMEDLDELESMANTSNVHRFAGLGQSAPNPILSTMKYFKDEYIAHVRDKKCPAGVCISMLRFIIADELCKRCGICAKNCLWVQSAEARNRLMLSIRINVSSAVSAWQDVRSNPS